MKRVLAALALVATVTALVLFGTGAASDSDDPYLVRAIFDNAAFVIPGEDVKVSGVTVGAIDDLDITAQDKAAVVLRIDHKGFQDFRADARCSVRPQSLIGEKFVECQPTQRRAADAPLPPPLREIERGSGKGQRLLPVERTSQSVDLDLLNNVMRLPYRQRFSIILNELGTGLAGRGDDLRQVVRRADPALREIDEVLEILGDQNKTLVSLAEDSDRALAPLARDRKRVTGFIESSADVAQATAERREDLEADIERLPRFLAELTPTMERLGEFADQAEPVMADLGTRAPQINQVLSELGPFSRAGIEAFDTLGEATKVGRPALRDARPVVRDIRGLARQAKPVGKDLADILGSLQETEGIERLMDLFFYSVSASNGFDEFGHYLRARLLVNNCSDYKIEPIGGCTSKFREPETEAQVASASQASKVAAKPAPEAQGSAQAAAVKAPAPAAKAPTAPKPPVPATNDAEQQAQDGMLDYLFGAPAK